MTKGRRSMSKEEIEEAKKNKIKRKTVDTFFGDLAISYISEKANEIIFGRNLESITTADIQRGIELEPFAFAKLKELKGLEFIDVKECSFFEICKDSGATPDALVGEKMIAEIKCPRPSKFFKLVQNGEKEIDIQYIYQMQMQMLATNTESCIFFNFIIYNGVEMWHEIEIKRDDVIISDIKKRIKKASLKRDEIIIKINKNLQFKI